MSVPILSVPFLGFGLALGFSLGVSSLALAQGAGTAAPLCPAGSLARQVQCAAADLHDAPRSRLGLNVRSIDSRDLTTTSGARSMSVEAAYPVIGSWGLAGYLTGGIARGLGLPTGTPGVGTASLRANESIGLGIIKSATWRSGDRLSLMVSQPLGAGGPRIGAEGPLEAVDANGFVGQRPLGLRASGREVTTELRYLAPVLKNSQVGLSLINRSNAFDQLVPDERIMTIRFSTQF